MPEPRPGTLILVVGPSGAGKDTLIEHTCRTFAGRPLSAARRIVTRDASDAEAHDTLDRAAFVLAAAQGAFAFQWQAHGLDYAVPVAIEARLDEGETVICNVSRGVVAGVRDRFPRVVVFYVDAPLAVRQVRIAGRRRPGEGPERARRNGRFAPEQADVVIENGGALADACRRFDAEIARVLEGRYEPLRGAGGKLTLPGKATE